MKTIPKHPPASPEARLEAARAAFLSASEALADGRNRAARAKNAFLRAQGPESRKKSRKQVEDALRDLRVATLEYQAAIVNLRRELSPAGRRRFEELVRRLDKEVAAYEEMSRLHGDATAAYESARANYDRARASLGRAHVPPKFDELMFKLEAAVRGRDKSIAKAHAAQRATLERLRKAMEAHEDHVRKPSERGRDAAAAHLDAAREAMTYSERHTADLGDAMEAWFEADKEFGMAVAALEAARGVPQVHRLEIRALDMLRALGKLTRVAVRSDEAAEALASTLGELNLVS